MLVAALVHAGAEYWSDEYPVLDVDGLAHPIQAFVGWLPSSIYWSSLARKGWFFFRILLYSLVRFLFL